MTTSAVLVATLGSEPQVVTIALQILLADGHPIDRVVVVHTDARAPVIGRALNELRRAFAAPPLEGIALQPYLLTQDGLPLRDIINAQEAQATFAALFGLIKELKRQECQIHFSIAGGRKVMALYGLAVAQILFDERDALYYLFSDDDLVRERRLLLQPQDQVTLVPIPFLRWTADAAVIADLWRFDDPLEAIDRSSELARRDARRRWELFCRHVLTPAEEAVVALVVREGLNNREVALRLGRSPKTVANQLSNVYAKLADYRGDEASRGVDRHTLIVSLHDHYAGAPE